MPTTAPKHAFGAPHLRSVDREALLGALRHAVSAGDEVALLVVDIDRFRIVNKSFGHFVGDALLGVVATRLEEWVRPNVTVARVGDDEFAIVVAADFDRQVVVAYGEHLVALLNQPVHVGGEEIRITVSVGVAISSGAGAGTSAESLLRDATLSLTHAKAMGGNQCELLDETDRRSALARARLETDLRSALRDRELDVYFQPVVRLDGTIVSLEALARWNHPVLGAVSPSEFVPLAEEAGLISELGAQVIELAAEPVRRWRATLAPSLVVSVNTSACQIAERGAADTIKESLARSGLEPAAVCLELTETAFLEDQDQAAAALTELHRCGIDIAVDDFGTGYSSLLYLHRFPVQIVKIDRWFTAGLGVEESATGIVEATIRLAHSLGLVVVAEGVETKAQLASLAELGCDLGQGFYWSRPLPVAEMGELLAMGPRLIVD